MISNKQLEHATRNTVFLLLFKDGNKSGSINPMGIKPMMFPPMFATAGQNPFSPLKYLYVVFKGTSTSFLLPFFTLVKLYCCTALLNVCGCFKRIQTNNSITYIRNNSLSKKRCCGIGMECNLGNKKGNAGVALY